MKIPAYLLAAALLLIVSIGCGEEPAVTENREEKIQGYWSIVSATRNGNATESLDQLYFDFQGTELETNLSGQPSKAPFVWDANSIQSSDPRLTVEYEVEQLTTDTLILTMEMRKFPFRFILARAERPE